MKEFCKCSAGKDLQKANSSIVKWDDSYGWILNWIELTEEEGYTQVHRYGAVINYCPMCGKLLRKP